MNKLLFIAAFFSLKAIAQNTVGLISYETGNYEGYILFSPMTSTKTYLIDKCGEKVHEWNTSTYRPGLSVSLLEDGSLLKTGILNNPNFDEGGSGGIIEKFDWNGNLTWSYVVSGDDFVQHHDIKQLPNGNILVIVWDRYTRENAIEKGKNTSYANTHLWSDKIIELKPVGTNSAEIVWEWKLWDHLIQDFDNSKPGYGKVSEHPELVNINYFPGQPTSMDWVHLNSVDYNPSTDQILLSSHTLNEIWIIDHSTTLAQAASHSGGNSGKGGDILYRWGNPQAYQRGNPSTKKLYGQHHATWIPSGFPNAGKILVFNNGLNRTGTYSSIDMIETPLNSANQYPIGATVAFAPTNLHWSYTSPIPTDFYSSNISGVYPIENGSFMITAGSSGRFFEIDENKQLLWQYISPVSQTGIIKQGTTPTSNFVFRCEFYPASYKAFSDKALTSLGEIELNPSNSFSCNSSLGFVENNSIEKPISCYFNPINETLNISTKESNFDVHLYDQLGRLLVSVNNNHQIDLSKFSNGIYFVKINQSGLTSESFKINK